MYEIIKLEMIVKVGPRMVESCCLKVLYLTSYFDEKSSKTCFPGQLNHVRFFFRDIACTSSIVSKINLQENLINKSCSIKIYCKDLGPTLRSLLTKKLPTNILENCLVS